MTYYDEGETTMNKEMREYFHERMDGRFNNPFNPYDRKGMDEPFWAMLMVADGECWEPYGSYKTFSDALDDVDECECEMHEHPDMYNPYTLYLCRMTSKGNVDNRCNYYRFRIE